MIISSIQNDMIKDLVRLHDKKYRDLTNLFLVEGEHLVEEAIKNNSLKEIIILENNDYDTLLNKIYVSTLVITKLSEQKTIPIVMGICEKKKEMDISGNVLILDKVQDPGNLGTIIRSAVAFNINTIILSPDSVDLYNEKVIRSTEGLLFSINIITRPILEAINELKLKDYLVIGSVVSNGEKVSQMASKYALIVGNEGQGISEEVLDLCDKKITIEINPSVESLNVGIATGIILYELNRR